MINHTISHMPDTLHDEKDSDDLKPEDGGLLQMKGATRALEGVVWRKLDGWVLPLCTGFFLLSALDRTNIANARLAGLQKSLAMSNYQYTIAITMTYISFTVAEIPSALLLKRIGPHIMLPAMVALWGIAAGAQGFVSSYSGLVVCQFFVGLFEGGIVPGIVLYLSSFYPRRRLQIRVTVFWSLTTLAGTFAGLLAAAIDQLNGKGGRPGWAWIFILEGAFTIVFGLISFFLLPRSPETARFLTKQERAYVVSALKQAGSVSEDDAQDHFSWTEVIGSATSPHLWLQFVTFFFSGATVLGLAYFEPTLVAGLGYSGNRAQLMSVPPYAPATVLAFASAFISDRYQCRGYTAIFYSVVQLIGFTIFYTNKSPHVRYGSLFLSIPGSFCVAPTLITWVANNSTPHARRATTVAISFMSTQLGGLLATWLFGWISPAPDYTTAMLAFIAMSFGMVLFSTANLLYLRAENRKKAERRQRMRKEDEPQGLGDRSAWFIYSL